MIHINSVVRLVKKIDEDVVVLPDTVGTVIWITTDILTHKPMFVVEFEQGIIGCFPNEVEDTNPPRRGVWTS